MRRAIKSKPIFVIRLVNNKSNWSRKVKVDKNGKASLSEGFFKSLITMSIICRSFADTRIECPYYRLVNVAMFQKEHLADQC